MNPGGSEDRVVDGWSIDYRELYRFPHVSYVLTVHSNMVVSPAKLTRGFLSGFMLLSYTSIFLSVSLKITSTELPVYTRI